MPEYSLRALKWYEYLKTTWKQAKIFLCRIKLTQMDYRRIEMKLVLLLILTPTHLQIDTKSNLFSSIQLDKRYFCNLCFLALCCYWPIWQKTFCPKIVSGDTFSANFAYFFFIIKKKKASFQFLAKLCYFPWTMHFLNEGPFFKTNGSVVLQCWWRSFHNYHKTQTLW